MKIVLSLFKKAGFVLLLCCGLTGCFSRTRIVQQTIPPEVVISTSVDALVRQLNDSFEAIKSLTAAVTITASTGGGRTGKVTEYTSFKGYILMRKPRDLYIVLQIPVLGSTAMEMASDGKNFKLIIPSQNKARIGTDEVKTPSKNALENLRPGIFFDAFFLKSVEPDEFVTVTDSERPLPIDPKSHIQPLEPDYDLAVMVRKTDNILQTRRVIHYNRRNLTPYKQDIYDPAGRIVTTVLYSNYQKFGEIEFPTEIDISRPFDEYALKITITKLTPNQSLDDEQFHLEIPAGMTIQNMN